MLSEISGENIGSLCFLFNFIKMLLSVFSHYFVQYLTMYIYKEAIIFFKQFVVSLLFLPIYTSGKSTKRSEEEWSICCVDLLELPH